MCIFQEILTCSSLDKPDIGQVKPQRSNLILLAHARTPGHADLVYGPFPAFPRDILQEFSTG